VKVSGINGYFMSKSGGNISSSPSKVWDGGSNIPDVIAAPPEADNITVGRAFDIDRDNDDLTRIRQQVGLLRATISVTPTDVNMVAKGTPTVYPDALLVGLSEPEMDSSGGDAAMWELEFAIGSYR
jgi:hypothetical protein